MSLILDALRKSEAERRKAQLVADALAEAPRTPASPLTGVPPWVWPAAVVTAMALAAWLWLSRTSGGDIGHATVAAPSSAGAPEASAPAQIDPREPDAAVGLAAAQKDGETLAATAVAAPLPTANATAAVPVPAPADSVASLAAANSSRGAAAPAAVPVPPPTPLRAVATSAAPAVATNSTFTTADSSPGSTTQQLDTASAAARLPTGSAPVPTVTPRAMIATAPPATTAPGTGPLRLADLSTADRQQLPPLKMSLHMWGADAAKRFAIIDGNRVGEGDRVGDTVVETIDQDGVVLAWNGTRLRVPVR